MLYLFALSLTFVAAYLAARSVLPVRADGFDVRVGAAVPAGRAMPDTVPSLWFRLMWPLLSGLAPIMRSIGWRSYREKAATQLQRAAFDPLVMTVDHLLAAKVVVAVVVPLLAAALIEMFRNPALFLGAAAGGFLLPDRLVADVRKAREREILRAMPGAVDTLSLSVEAGLDFLHAIQRFVERGGKGPLRDELATILNDIRLGNSRSEALKAFAARVEIPAVSSFVSVLVQADMLGASIGPVLQSQAERMRVERFQRAEKEGARATQKILIPMVLFIFPAVLIVVLGPVALQFLTLGE